MDDGTPRVVINLGLQWLEHADGKVTAVRIGSFLRLFAEKELCSRTSWPSSTAVLVLENIRQLFPRGALSDSGMVGLLG